MGRSASLVIVFLLFILTAVTFGTPSDITLTVSPQVGLAPVQVRAKVWLEPSEANRQLCITIQDDLGPVSRSCWPVTGKSPRLAIVALQVREPGEFDVIATVDGVFGQKHSIPVTLHIVGRGAALLTVVTSAPPPSGV